MAHPVEPMDIDNIDSDFDNKENTFHHNNVQPCTEKGYEELDVSELNMRLRYSVTPAASPMSKSYNSYVDNRNVDSDDSLNITANETNLTRSLNATLTKNDSIVKSLKSLPLQSLPTEKPVERNASVLRQLDSTITGDNNITVTISASHDIDENLSLPSSPSSAVPTPEATTPTKEIPKSDGGSPIMRGLKSVLNMFRSSQSPIPPPENENTTPQQLTPTATRRLSSEPRDKGETKTVLASTPISSHTARDSNGSKRNSPLKDSITFNDDLEKELQWKDETTILFSQEKIPIHKLFYQQKPIKVNNKVSEVKENLDTTVEYMDISYNESLIKDRTITENEQEILKNVANESDSEFLDCETESNATKIDSYITDNKIVDLIEGEHLVQKSVDNVINSEDKQLMQCDDPKNHSLNVIAPMGIINKEESLDNKLLSLIVKENIYTSNKSTQDNNLINAKDHLNLTKEISSTSQETKSEMESSLEKSVSNSEHLNLDVTMTTDDKEPKNKSLNYLLEVSTLETHTKSLSSLIESLDVTKSFDEEKANIEANDSLEFTTTINQDTLNFEAFKSDKSAFEKPAKNPDVTDINATITINDQENKSIEDVTISGALNLNHFEQLLTSTKQNLDVIVSLDKKEKDSENKDNIFTLENEVVNTTFDITKGTIKEVLPMTIPTKHLQEIITRDTLQHTPLNESPADAPLPDDDDMEKDLSTVVDVSDSVANNVSPFLMDRNIVEMLNENAVVIVSDLSTTDKHLSDMLLQTSQFNNKINNETTSLTGVEDVAKKEMAEESEKVNSEDCRQLESQQQIEEDTVIDQVKNIETTINMRQCNGNQNVDKVDILPDIFKKHVNDDGTTQSLSIHNVSDEIGESKIDENQLLVCKNRQDKSMSKTIQSHIDSTMLSDNKLEASISACEEILDKNREISEVFLSEQKIDKFQHANDVALSYHEVKDESLIVSQNSDYYKMLSNQSNITIKGNLTTAGDNTKRDATLITKLENKDANIIVTIEQDVKFTHSAQVLPENEINCKLDEIETANESITIEEINTTNDIEKCGLKSQDLHKQENDMVQKEEIDNKTTDKIVKVEDVKTDYKQKDVVQEVKVKSTEQDNLDIQESLPMQINTSLPEEPDSVIGDDEIIVSGNNSPYVSVAADLDKVSEEKPFDNLEGIEKSCGTVSNVPSSPPITSKGYNFNFDEIDDPFATKVKIRLSPSPDNPNKTIDVKNQDKSFPRAEPIKKDLNKNRRKSQPARQKLSNTKKPFNVTFDGSVGVLDTDKPKIKSDTSIKQSISDVKYEEKQIAEIHSSNDISATISSDVVKESEKVLEIKNIDVVDAEMVGNVTLTEEKQNDITMSEENKALIQSIIVTANDLKTTSSSEQSTYYSAGTSSSESIKSKNVFNLPEIEDMNFNPFETKSKIRQSPSRDIDMDNSFATKSKIINSPDVSMVMQQNNGETAANMTINIENDSIDKHLEDKMETELMEKDSSVNISNTTCSSKATDKDITIREVNTEDEDTIEGPFLEAEDNEDKQSDFDADNEDMMRFNDMPVQENDENADGELFIDAEAFEFLLNQNKSNVVADSGKESLFLKFDPLFAKRMSSDSVVAALSRAQKRQSTPSRTPKLHRNAPPSVAGPSTMNLTYEADLNTTETTEDVNTTVSKPTMVVTPAVNPTVTLRKSVTPTRSNRRSITFTSPAMAVIDRLLSLSANNSLVEQETVPQVSREQNEAELALTQLREVLAEKEINVYNLRSESKELKDRLATLESQMKVLETESQVRLKKINDLNEKLSEKTKMNKSMAVVVEEYERTIASLIAETEQDKKRHAEERIALMNERDEQTAHLASMEVSFNDLHSKYEKSKQVIMNYKANEESYKQSLKEFEENVSKMQKNYELLKQHATSKLNHANDELQKINRSHEAEVLKLNAMIKRKDLHITSLEETLAQKTKANEELTAICDELINKVG